MAAKKTANVLVPVVKTKIVEARNLNMRASRDLIEELKALFADGWKVTKRDSGGPGASFVRLHLQKTEEWTFDEFVADMTEELKR